MPHYFAELHEQRPLPEPPRPWSQSCFAPPGRALGTAGSTTAQPAPAAAESQSGGQSALDQLKELGELKSQGILTDEEFAAQKAKLLEA